MTLDMKIHCEYRTLNAGENLGISSLSARSHTSAFEQSQRQGSTKALRQQQLQEAITEQRLTDCLEHLENLNFLDEQTQLFCLNLAQGLNRGCKA